MVNNPALDQDFYRLKENIRANEYGIKKAIYPKK